MRNVVIIFVSVVSVISLSIAILILCLFIQRRRQRAFLMHAIAQEEAERRRRKRKKAGLRRWEIDLACPESLVSHISPSLTSLQVFTYDSHPDQYSSALESLRTNGFFFDSQTPPQLLNIADDDLSVPPPLMLKENVDSTLPEVTSEVPSDTGDDIPLQVVHLPESMETCVICLNDIVVGARIRPLPCLHVYHSQCIRIWLRRRNACPCCCVKVIKRRKKRERIVDHVALGAVREPDLEQTSPRTPSPVGRRQRADSLVDEHLMPIVVEERTDSGDNITVDFFHPRSKSMGYGEDRPRSPSVNLRPALQRNGYLMDLEDGGSEVLASDASSHVEESSATELLEQVRKALRGGSSLNRLTVDDATSDIDDNSFRRSVAGRPHLELDLARRPAILAASVTLE